jgi:hypothetical protein
VALGGGRALARRRATTFGRVLMGAFRRASCGNTIQLAATVAVERVRGRLAYLRDLAWPGHSYLDGRGMTPLTYFRPAARQASGGQ